MSKPGRFPLLIVLVLFLGGLIVAACGQSSSVDPTSAVTPIMTSGVIETPGPPTPGIAMTDIADFLTTTAVASSEAQQTPGAALPGAELVATAVGSYPVTYVFLPPTSMKLNQSYILDLYMSRSDSQAKLATAIVTANALATSTSEAGTLIAPGGQTVEVHGGQIEVSGNVRAELMSENPQAFEIESWNGDGIRSVEGPTQVIWQWRITPKQEGRQALILLIYQQVNINASVQWYSLPRERRVVKVDVTMGQRLSQLNWRWIISTVLAVLAIAALWRGINLFQGSSRSRRRSKIRRGEGSQQDMQQNVLNLLPNLSRADETARKAMGHIFISYRRSDSADIAGRIYDRLVEAFGEDPIFKDVDSIPLGVDFKKYLDEKVGECTVLLAIIGDRWVDATDPDGKKRLEDRDDFVRIEIESALKRGIPVIPLLVRGARMPVEGQLPHSLRGLVFKNGIQIRPDPDFHHDMDRLISALQDHL